MKLSAHHSTHGLEGTVRLLATGEALHVVFPKGKFRAEVQINIGGHRMETAFLLEPIKAKKGEEVDMRIRLEAPFQALPTGKALPAAQDVQKAPELAGDGSPMVGTPLPMGAPPATRFLLKDGLPPGSPAEPAPRDPTPREARALDRMQKLEGKLAR